MAVANSTLPNSAVLAERVETVKSDVAEIKAMLMNMQASQTLFNERYISDNIVLTGRVRAAHERIDALGEWQSDVDKLLPVLKAEAWAIGVIAAPVLISVIMYLWQLLNHGATP